MSNINDESPEYQILSIKDFAPVVKTRVGELLRTLFKQKDWAKTTKEFKDQCGKLIDTVKDWKQSSARAGATQALTLVKTYYPIIKLEKLAKGRPATKQDGTTYTAAEYKEVVKLMRPFATIIAGFADLDSYHHAYGIDGKARGNSHSTPNTSNPETKVTSSATAQASDRKSVV